MDFSFQLNPANHTSLAAHRESRESQAPGIIHVNDASRIINPGTCPLSSFNRDPERPASFYTSPSKRWGGVTPRALMKAADISDCLPPGFCSPWSLSLCHSSSQCNAELVPSSLPWRFHVASQHGDRRNWGAEGCEVVGGYCESVFSQQLALHKAFITPKRLRLPKPERDKHCPFICNDVEAGGKQSELKVERSETLQCEEPRGGGTGWLLNFIYFLQIVFSMYFFFI